MSWLLPVALVVVVSLLMAAAHFLFVRWWARAADPDRTRAGQSPPRDDEAR
jgi:hypothetical protein